MFFSLVAVALFPAAHALTAPAGWTQSGPSRALLDPQQPAKGELREFRVSGGSGDPDEIDMMLRGGGLEASVVQLDDDGAVNLVFADRLGRARCVVQDGAARWVVVLAGSQQAQGLDPDALLDAALASNQVAWGAPPTAARSDAAPWGEQAPQDDDGWWGDDSVQGWTIDRSLVGTWRGTLLLTGQPTLIMLRFESNGRVALERKGQGQAQAQNFDGTWGARKDRVRMSVPGGGENLLFQLMGETLRLEYAGVDVTLHRAKS